MKTIEGATAAATIEWLPLKGKLLVIEPLEVEKGIKTRFTKPGEEPGDAVRANVYVVQAGDGSKYEPYEDVLIFPKVLQSQTRKKMGSIVVGRLTQGEARKGESPPWNLAEPSEKDMRAATALVSVLNTQSVSADSGDDFDEGVDEAPPADEDGEF